MDDDDNALAHFDETLDFTSLLAMPFSTPEEPSSALSPEASADVSQLVNPWNCHYNAGMFSAQQALQHDPQDVKQDYEQRDFAIAVASSLQDKLLHARATPQVYPTAPTPSTSSCIPRGGRRVPLESIHADSEEMAGRYRFRISFQDLKGSKRNIEYDDVAKKLYVSPFKQIKISCVVTDDGTWNARPVFLRIIPKFVSNAEQFKPVVRCSQHCNPEDPTNIGMTEEQAKHFVRLTPTRTTDLDQPLVQYDSEYVQGDNRLSVKMALPTASSHQGCDIVANFGVRFMCYHACRVSGLQRQRISLFFILETTDGECLGRQVIEVRSCASPGRDYKTDVNKRKDAGSNPGGSRKKALKRPHYVLVNSARSSDSEAGCSTAQVARSSPPPAAGSSTSNNAPRRQVGYIMKPESCCVWTCGHRLSEVLGATSPCARFIEIPADDGIRRQWLTMCKVHPDLWNTPSLKLCSCHFECCQLTFGCTEHLPTKDLPAHFPSSGELTHFHHPGFSRREYVDSALDPNEDDMDGDEDAEPASLVSLRKKVGDLERRKNATKSLVDQLRRQVHPGRNLSTKSVMEVGVGVTNNAGGWAKKPRIQFSSLTEDQCKSLCSFSRYQVKELSSIVAGEVELPRNWEMSVEDLMVLALRKLRTDDTLQILCCHWGFSQNVYDKIHKIMIKLHDVLYQRLVDMRVNSPSVFADVRNHIMALCCKSPELGLVRKCDHRCKNRLSLNVVLGQTSTGVLCYARRLSQQEVQRKEVPLQDCVKLLTEKGFRLQDALPGDESVVDFPQAMTKLAPLLRQMRMSYAILDTDCSRFFPSEGKEQFLSELCVGLVAFENRTVPSNDMVEAEAA